jgi:hypothetical protein
VSIQIVGNQKRIIWTEPGAVLQESSNLITWSDVTGATSPYTSPAGRAVVFYRLRK